MAATTASAPVADTLNPNQVQPLLKEAMARWAEAGVNTALVNGVHVVITNLSDKELGEVQGHTIYLDVNAAGWGWFVDLTPADDSEFTIPGNQGERNRIDLLTVLEHELGHLLGYDHTDAGLMSPTLATGLRETPTAVLDQVFATLP